MERFSSSKVIPSKRVLGSTSSMDNDYENEVSNIRLEAEHHERVGAQLDELYAVDPQERDNDLVEQLEWELFMIHEERNRRMNEVNCLHFLSLFVYFQPRNCVIDILTDVNMHVTVPPTRGIAATIPRG